MSEYFRFTDLDKDEPYHDPEDENRGGGVVGSGRL